MFKKSLALIAVLAASVALVAGTDAAKKKKGESMTRSFRMVNVEYKGTKIWLPGLIAVKAGETVSIKLINNAPSGVHGFALDAFKIKEAIPAGETKTVTFTIPRKGAKDIYTHYCHLHAAHIGGQIIVED